MVCNQVNTFMYDVTGEWIVQGQVNGGPQKIVGQRGESFTSENNEL